jgi:hypothetical protein
MEVSVPVTLEELYLGKTVEVKMVYHRPKLRNKSFVPLVEEQVRNLTSISKIATSVEVREFKSLDSNSLQESTSKCKWYVRIVVEKAKW